MVFNSAACYSCFIIEERVKRTRRKNDRLQFGAVAFELRRQDV